MFSLCEDEFTNDVCMTIERFTDYQLSTTSIIAAVERGNDTFDNAARWRHASIAHAQAVLTRIEILETEFAVFLCLDKWNLRLGCYRPIGRARSNVSPVADWNTAPSIEPLAGCCAGFPVPCKRSARTTVTVLNIEIPGRAPNYFNSGLVPEFPLKLASVYGQNRFQIDPPLHRIEA